MKSPFNQDSSLITAVAGLPLIFALKKSGYCVDEWFPQTARLVTAVDSTPALAASWDLARFSSKRVMAKNRSRGISGALFMAIKQLVLHGLPTTRMRTSASAFF